MRYIITIFTLLLFIVLMTFLWRGLKRDPHELPSALIGKPVPEFNYASLLRKEGSLSNKMFLGHVSLLNVWATWCITCHAEHPVLMDIAHSGVVTVYGLNYKDDFFQATDWLKKYGNPYADVIFDGKGTLAIDFGVYGTPETFVIDSKGIIRDKYIGAISPDVWKNKIEPEVLRLQGKS
ncbi:MAG TPA: DsbE family thiol:disulfide interchange protein [Gammaproteobacteria bacterium]|nr:DsbE family thiol:disulfide interchange protein [Gammaproteobacteria bacterium]